MSLTFDRIKNLAKKQGLSINLLEEKLGYSRNTIYNLKSSKPSAERLQEIADYFNVSTDYLLGRTDNPNILIASTETENVTSQYAMIQRKAKSLSVSDQERLLQIMDLTFQDVLNGGVDDEHDF